MVLVLTPDKLRPSFGSVGGGALPALVEGVDVDPVVFVLLQDLLCVFVCVEGVHKNERHVGVEGFVQMLKNNRKPESQRFGS